MYIYCNHIVCLSQLYSSFKRCYGEMLIALRGIQCYLYGNRNHTCFKLIAPKIPKQFYQQMKHQFWDLPLKRTIFQGTLFPHFYNFLDKNSCSMLLFSQNFWNLQSNVHILEKSWIFSKKIDCSLTGCTNCPRFAPIYECMYEMNSVDSQKLTCIKQQ